jgi:hypothetical protein
MWRKRSATCIEHRKPVSIITKPVSDKKNFVLRIDSDTYRALEKWAADEFRSVNGQIEWVLSQKLKETGRIKEAAPKGKTGKGST